MTRTHLLSAVSAAALACLGAAQAAAQTSIYGGGSTSTEFDWIGELSVFNASQTSYVFSADNAVPSGIPPTTFTNYFPAGSSAAQAAVIGNDYSCFQNKLTGYNGGNCNGVYGLDDVGNPVTVAFGASDSPLSSAQDAYVNGTQVGTWATATFGEQLAGDLIQIPLVGTGEAIPVVNANVSKNGQAALTDTDLCGIFSGTINDWSQITDVPSNTLGSGPITVVYRADGSGSTFIFTNHLAAVCGAIGNTGAVTFAATSNFASVFPTSPSGIYTQKVSISGVGTFYLPTNFVGQKQSSGVADYLSGLSNGPVTSAIGYVTPDWTTVAPNSGAVLSNGQKSALVVAGLYNGATATGHASVPYTESLLLGLQNVATGQYLTGPTQANAHDPAQWLPLVGTVNTATARKGTTTYYSYPIVGYSAVEIPQCFANKAVATGIVAYLKAHYSKTVSYNTVESNNGFVAIPNVPAEGKLLSAIERNILTHSTWNAAIEDLKTCKTRAGR